MQYAETYGKGDIAEIFEPFIRSHPNSLLVRGQPGTGKTTFCLEFVRKFSNQFKVRYYVSTRVSLEKLKQTFPHAETLFNRENVISIEKTMHKNTAIDARLGTSQYLLDVIIKAAASGNALIVLDSWESIAKEIEYTDRIKIEKTISTVAEANKCLVLFVSEEPEKSTLPFLVDGIVTLGYEISDYERLRTITIDKLRGVQIRHPQYLFSLNNAKFELLSQIKHVELKGMELFPPVCIARQFISTGNLDLDRALGGGIRRGSLVLLELSVEASRSSLALILADIVMNNLSQGNPAIVVSTPDKTHKNVLKYVAPFCRKEDIENLVLFSHKEKDTPPCVKQLPGTLEENDALFLREYEELKAKCGPEIPIVITYDLGMTEISRPEIIRQIESKIMHGVRRIRSNGDVEILVNRSGFSSMAFSKAICDVHLRLTDVNGISLLDILRPRMGRYVIIFDDTVNYPSYKVREID